VSVREMHLGSFGESSWDCHYHQPASSSITHELQYQVVLVASGLDPTLVLQLVNGVGHRGA
jgi:hypothetical protein